ncbi:hypothetical protein, partial [Prevotella corporis]|uniref:hypothetical protein n=1 Tax=Prevotella corporis TaxID=28128 RepID=UPI0023F0E50A
LDLNADYLKQICLLNPNLLSKEHSQKIKRAFEPLKHRKINSVFEEVNDKDRIKFDQTVFECFRLDKYMLPSVYTLLTSAVTDRVTLKNK